MIHRSADAFQECGRCILKLLEAKPRSTMAISGGSSPKPMFEMFAKAEFDWSRVDLFWADERGVPPDNEQSNFKLANDLWLGPAGFPKANIHRMRGELPAEAAARLYTDEIRDVLKLAPGVMPEFDVIHLGLGPDSHTASLFPGEPMIDDRRGLAAAVWVERFQQWRITLLPGVLLAAKHIAVLVTGRDKDAALRTVLEGAYDPKLHPAQLLLSALDVEWFVSD